MAKIATSQVYKLAKEAVEKMREERGQAAKFSIDELWRFASAEIPSEQRPAASTWLTKQGLIETTGLVTSATTAARAGSPTREYRFAESSNAANGKPPGADFLDAFQSALAGELTFSRPTLLRFTAALLAKPFVILTGLSGSGKTKLAQAFARWITPAAVDVEVDPFTPGTKLKGPQAEYTVIKSNAGIVEVTGEDGKIAALPRSIIAEWADYIEKNAIPLDTSAHDIRDKVEAASKYISYLHRMQSSYKPAALALLEARKKPQSAQCFAVVPVGADWTSNEHILGYPDSLNGGYFQQTALRLILQAERNPKTPHFLILDEMNLSHVERYFADLLSHRVRREPLATPRRRRKARHQV